MMTKEKTEIIQKPVEKAWNFPHLDVVIFAPTAKEALEKLKKLSKKTTND